MKRKLLIVISIILAGLFANRIYSQGLYVKINSGYNASSSQQNLGDFYNYTANEELYTYEPMAVSLGKGMNLGANIGYMFNSKFGIDLGLSYLIGGKSTFQTIYYRTDDQEFYEDVFSSKMLRVSPSFIFVADLLKINPYAKFGLVIGMGKITHDYTYMFDSNGTFDATDVEELSGGLALGLTAGIGALYNLTGNISLFGEINMINMSWAPEKGKLIESITNGEDQLPSLSVEEKETIFVDKLTRPYMYQTDPNKPRENLKMHFPFGSFGVNFGLRIGF